MRNLNPNDGEGETMHLETRLEATGAPQGLHDLANQLIGASPRMGMARALIAKVAAND